MDLESIQQSLRDELNAKHQAREQGITLSRKTIRLCANSIRSIHRGNRQEAHRLLGEAKLLLDEAAAAMQAHPDIKYAGFYHDAAKEYAEGRVTYSLIFDEQLPGPKDLGVEAPAYLKGMGEAVGEVRRHLLDLMRRGELERSEQLMAVMDEIYYLLITMDYPDGMTGGLRRTTDIARSIIERTRGDLSTTIIQDGLRNAIEDMRDRA